MSSWPSFPPTSKNIVRCAVCAEWNAKYENEQSMLNTSERVQSHVSGAQDYKKMDRDDSETLRMGEWAWILRTSKRRREE